MNSNTTDWFHGLLQTLASYNKRLKRIERENNKLIIQLRAIIDEQNEQRIKLERVINKIEKATSRDEQESNDEQESKDEKISRLTKEIESLKKMLFRYEKVICSQVAHNGYRYNGLV